MFTVRAPIIAVLCAVAFVAALAAPASAGGPTSAILSVPGEGKTASLYYTDTAYNVLARLVDAEGMSVPGKVDESGQTHERGPGVTVTWLIHDVQPWRVDRIYLNAEGGPWIATQVMDGETGSIWDSPVVWHQSTSGKELTMLLDQLGVGEAAPSTAGLDDVAAAPMPTEEEPAAAPKAAAEESAVSGVWWGLGGLAAGALLAFGWMRARSSRENEPDLDTGTDWLAPQTRSTSAYGAPPASRA